MRLSDGFLAVLVAALWGVNFVAAKFGMQHFPPYFLTALRFALVAMLLVPFVPRPDKAALKHIFLLSFALGTLHFPLLFAALWHGLDITTCTIMTQLGVPFSCILGVVFLNDRLGVWRISGIIIAFYGVMRVVGIDVGWEGGPMVTGFGSLGTHKLALTLALAGSFSWGIANIVMKRIPPMPIFSMLGWMALFAVPQLLLVSWFIEGPQYGLLLSMPLPSALGILYTVFGSTILAYGLWYTLLQKYDVSQVSPFALLVPFFGIASGQLFFNEGFTDNIIVGGIVTMIGVGIIVIRRPKITAMGEAT